MHLVYLDESGNSGLNLADPQQPVFVLCAMVVAENEWQGLEAELKAVLDARLPKWRETKDFEVHGADLRRGTGHFSGMKVGDRIAFRDEWMHVGEKHGVALISRSVAKKPYIAWLTKEFGTGILINPHVVAFYLLSRCIDSYLKGLPSSPLGMLISDENKEIVADVEKSIHVLRGLEGNLKLGQIIEKGFFIDSAKSLPLQLCDLYALSLRKGIERQRGFPAKSVDDTGIKYAAKLTYRANLEDADVLTWLKANLAKK